MYANLKAIFDKTRLDMFCMAVSHLLDIGYRAAREITDEDIESMEGNGLMTKGFCQSLTRLTRQIAKETEIPEIIQFCSAYDIFEVTNYANKLSRDRLETLLANAICGISEYSPMGTLDIMDYICADEDEMKMLGYEVESYEED